MSARGHVPVLLQEVLEFLNAGREGIYIDSTLGLGGHAVEILRRNPKARLVGLDIDEQALTEAQKKLISYQDRVQLFHADYRLLPELAIDFSTVRGILFDLGLSSFQVDSPERGFSFNLEGPLDMRMDLRNKTTAFKVINTYSEPRLSRIFREFGELKPARRLANAIVARRRAKKFETTTELRLLVEDVCHWIPQKGKVHPAAKVFQALRIEVNNELEGLGELLESLARKMATGTRLVVISFHSLEDRIVKRTLARLASSDGPATFRLLTRKPITPTEQEIALNFRSRSAKLRAAEKL